ncbi:MAG: NADP-dependent oxidoreductase, partial [Burkholderiales bacterium]|nr:NADP-dependent oxidoreductase [Burkholderiales bacterium]
MNQQLSQSIVLASRPRGALREENFRLEARALPELKEGEVLVRSL